MSTTKRDYNTLHSYASKAYKITKSSDQIRDWSKDTWNALKRLKVKNDMNNFERKFDKLTKRDRLFLSRHAEQGSLSFQLYKCTNPTCCKPLRSNIRQFLPTGRLPTPTLFERKDNGHIVAVKPNTKPTKDMRFGDLFMNRTLSPANNVSIDTYRHDIPLEKRKESMCSVCMKSFANKTQKENHRKACHRGNVGTQIEDEDLELDEVPMYDVIGDEALKIIGKRNGLYLVQYADSTEWAQLSDECPLVKDFKEDEAQDDELPLISNAMMCDWVKNRIPNELIHEQDLI
eukprot:1127641_1